MRFFYIAVNSGDWLEDVASLISEASRLTEAKLGVKIGMLIRFTSWRRVCVPCKTAEAYGIPLFVDNSAFDILSRDALDGRASIDVQSLEKWVWRYTSWLATWHGYVTAAALPDVPVHGSRFVPAPERLERIRLTARLHQLAAKLLRRTGALDRMVVVLQGYTVAEYIESLRLHLDTPGLEETCTFAGGCPYHRVAGVGSVCVRKPSARGKTGRLASGEAAGTLHEFMRSFLDTDWEHVKAFHFFGLHTDAVAQFASHPRYFASDTGAHALDFRYKWRTTLRCRSPDKSCYLKAILVQLRRVFGDVVQPLLEEYGVGLSPTLYASL